MAELDRVERDVMEAMRARMDYQAEVAQAAAAMVAGGFVEPPGDKWELADLAYRLTGIEIPAVKVCAGHVAPLDGFAAAFFAEAPFLVWEASRGFGGKSVLLALLGFLEATVLGASVSVLGGSAEQSQRVLDYMSGESEYLPDKFWAWPGAPLQLVKGSIQKRKLALTNLGGIRVLAASQKSVRGPHPVRLRLDEVDEMDIEIFDAALGQPMPARGLQDQTVASSTHHNSAGTMAEIKRRAADRGWPIYTWCYRESLAAGWLSQEAIDRKRSVLARVMWETEYELQEPSPESRAIMPAKVEAMFDLTLGEASGEEYVEFEEPESGAVYVTGADWAKQQDKTCIVTFRVEAVGGGVGPTGVGPTGVGYAVPSVRLRLVAFEQMNRRPWPYMAGRFDRRLERYPGEAAHDQTGVGDVVDDILVRLEDEVMGVLMVGRLRSDMLTEYIAAVEAGTIVAPRVEYMYTEHKYASVGAVFGPRSAGHLPDSFAAGALAYYAYKHPRPPKKKGWAATF